MSVVVCYNVVGDSRRARLLRVLKGFPPHVQKSVFEGELSDARLVQMRAKVLEVIDPREDTVRIYNLCRRCIPGTEILGTGVYVETEERDEIF